MDRNQTIGLILISAILLVYVFFFAPEPPETSYANPKTDSTAAPKTQREAKAAQLTAALPDSVISEQNRSQYGEFAPAASGSAKQVVLNNNKLQVAVNTKGATISQVLLKDYKTFDKKPLVLLDSASSNFSLNVAAADGKQINLNNLYYTSAQTTSANGGQVVTLTANLGGNKSVVQVYALEPDSYVVDYDVQLNNLAATLAKGPARINWTQQIKRNEYDLQQSRDRTTINYFTGAGEFDYLTATETDSLTEKLEEPVKWVAHKEKFFNSALISAQPFVGATLTTIPEAVDSSVVKTLQSSLIIPEKDIAAGRLDLHFFFGPNDYKTLKAVDEGFKKNLDLGWGPLAWVNEWLIIPVFDFLEQYLTNFGIIIILLVIFIKTVLFPLTYKSYISMAKMRVLKPELDEIKARHGGDLQKSQQETMQLYGKMGVNPISGCIPVLLSMPILLAMFNFFPNSIELRQEAFLWANDLSTYDVFARLPFTIPFYGSHVSMFTLLMTASTILYTWSNNQVSTMQGPMVAMSYLMPIVFLFVLNSFPAGLSFYYLVSNLVTFGQQAGIRAFVDEKKIRAKLEENVEKNKNKKKSSFTQRLEEAMKASQQRAEEVKKQPTRRSRK